MIKNVVIDLSHWEETVDFKLAKGDGILGVIHKATQGLGYVDPTYAERRKAAEEQGLLYGAYHFGTGGLCCIATCINVLYKRFKQPFQI